MVRNAARGPIRTIFKAGLKSGLKAGGLAAMGLGAALVAAPDKAAAQDVSLTVQSAWPLTLPASGRDAQHFADIVTTASDGAIEVDLYAPGRLVPPLEIFDAVRNGTLDAGFTSPLYVAGKFPAVQLFGGIPFGPDAFEYLGWIYNGGGLDIWREIYDAQGVVTIPCSLMEAESGGWYAEPIETVEDLEGLKLRFAGLAGEVMKKLGASVVLLAGGNIFPNLERGVIDGTEFSMPTIDQAVGFEKVVKNYYVPGWHQPAAINELIINKAKWEEMSEGQQKLIELACRETMVWGVTSTLTENAAAIDAFKEAGVTIRQFPPDVLAAFEQATAEVMEEQAANNPDFKRVWDSLQAYRANAASWTQAGGAD
ncbi:TRAP transporter substrate-binding protein [Acuticoccus sp. M5D2P5]|uniref:TRAP transporter substrate-binding protein n=1 Tax=Acuticoccus kalidii TaxID=2910977 RepID=UPI001F297599|nr:TRAP transporter substrate-binding protein [Acuticoccus kalidii]MCF3935491.1 TRAP transporter substrate-binding protein [Acuticoccus kalidii]